MATSYQKLSLAEKRALDLSRVREPSLPCPRGCGMSLMPADLLSHLEQRCPGQPDPWPGAKWVTLAEARKLGVSQQLLSYWAARGFVRCRGGRGDRQYLHRDLVARIAKKLGFHRR